MNRSLSVLGVFGFLLGAAIAAQAITVDMVAVGNAGNSPDTTGYGEVDYSYQIGKYEITAGQYAAFLNAVAATRRPIRLVQRFYGNLCGNQRRLRNPADLFQRELRIQRGRQLR